MSTYTGDPNNAAPSITIPDAGAPRTVTTYNAPIMQIWDSIAALREGRVDSVQVEQFHSLWRFDPSQWAWSNTGIEKSYLVQQTVASAVRIYIPLNLPVGCTLDEVRVYVKPDGAHVGLPANMPHFDVFEAGPYLTEPTPVTVADQTDPSVLGVYNGWHSFFRAGIDWVIQPQHTYEMTLRGEAGANAIASMAVFAVRTTCTVTSLDPRGGG
jgi:hypothetical protein